MNLWLISRAAPCRIVAISAFFGAVATLFAASPRLNSLSPAGGQSGSNVEVRFSGARFDAAPEILFTEPGIQSRLESARTNQVRAILSLAPDCRLGEHQLRIRTAGGLTELRTFWVGSFTNIAEIETNNSIAQAQVIQSGVTINGACGGDDTDVFRIDAKKGDRISAEIEGIRLGRAMLDTRLTIRDAEKKVLASADDTSLLAQDPFVSIIAPNEGAYYVELHDSTYSGSGGADYRLHIGANPRPSIVYPLGGKAGAATTFTFIGDAAGNFSQTNRLPAAASEKYGLFAEQKNISAPSPNWIRVSDFENQLESETNDTRETATVYSGELPVAFNGIIGSKSDVDWFKFTAKKGAALDVNVYARRLRSPLDSVLQITDAKGGSLAVNEDAAGADSVLKWNVPADGDYFVKVTDQFGNGGPDHVYRVEITPQQPAIALNIPQVARNDSQTRQYITVPRGNRFATMISAKRANAPGPIRFSVDGLPPGVKLESETLPAALEQQPLVFVAAPDAPVGGRYVDLVAKPEETGKTALSSYRHEVEFISGPNNTFYYNTTEPQLYVAVCEEAPFTIRIEEPKVPIVQYGALDLKIIAERRPGFDEPINVRMMWNPPGVSSQPDITIPKGTNTAVYQLNARADAQVNKWKIAVLASTGSDRNGSTFVSSALTPIVVAEPFVVGAMHPVMVSPGQETNLVCKLDQKKPFEGKAKLRLLGLPEGITASDAEISSSDKEVNIKLSVSAKVPHASYRNFICAAEVMQKGEVILHNLASGAVIRVVPPKKEAPRQVAKN